MLDQQTVPRGTAHPRLLFIYLLNATLVLCHEIDSAYWHEWQLFRLPGGPEGFVAMHLLVVLLILVGLVMVVNRTARSRLWSIAIGSAGTAGCAIHLAFLTHGNERFTTVFSIALIAAFGLSSATLTVIALRTRPLAMEEKDSNRVFS